MDSSTKSGSGSQSSGQSSGQKMCLACNLTFPDNLTHCPKDGTQLISFGHDENLGKVINEKYKIIELVGKGGMGSVYLAEDLTRSGFHVAVKMLHAQLSEDKMSVKRFQQEASAASDLHHPNLIKQYDYGMIDGKTPYLVMEYLEGESLSEIIKERGPVNPVRALRIFSQVMDGLKYAHEKGVVHRDIKPSNILLLRGKGGDDVVKVLDFGLAKLMPWSGKESQHLTKTGEVFGSPIYMSPEQCMGKPLEPSSDIYSLGITLFESLTGKPPFRGQNVVQTASKHLSDPPPPFESVCPELNLPLNLQGVVFTALEKEPVHRFHDMAEFKSALGYAVTGQGQANAKVLGAISADATQPVKKVDLDMLKSGPGPQKGAKQMPVPLMIGVGLSVLVLIGGAVFMFMSGGSKKESTPAGVAQPTAKLPHNASGTIYYLALRANRGPKNRISITEVHLQTASGLVKLTGNIFPKSSLDLQIGKEWEVSYKGDDRTGELEKYKSTGNESPDVTAANNIVENYFAQLADSDTEDVFNMLSDNFVKKNYKGLSEDAARKKFADSHKKELYQDYRNGKDRLSLDANLSPMAMPTAPPQATKVLKVKPTEVQILIDTSMFYAKTHGYECFTIINDEGNWKIERIEKVDQAVWDAQ